MAYKFQLGPAVKSGSLEQEGSINIVDDGSGTFELKVAGTAVVDSSRSVTVGNLFKMPDVTSGKLLVADGTSYEEVALSGDATLASNGALTIANSAVSTAKIADDAVTPAKISIFDDNLAATDTHILIADGSDYSSFALSGDVSMTNAGVVTIANNAVENAMMADDSVGADELIDDSVGAAAMADNAVGTSVIVDNAVTLAKLAGITRGSIILGDASGDPSLLAKGTAAQFLQSDGTDPSYVSMSGQATLAAGGALSLAVDAISAQTEMTGDVADTDELMINDGGALKRLDFSVLRDAVFNDVSGDATVAAGGALTIAANAVEGSMLNANVVADTLQYSGSALRLSASVAGAGVGFAAGVLSLDIDELDALGGTGVDQTDHFVFSDGGTEKKITFSNMEDAIFGNVSGDATIAAGGALTIANNAVENAMMADDSVGADELIDDSVGAAAMADNAVGTSVIVDDAVTPAKMSLFDDNLAATDTHILIADGSDYSSFALSGDVTMTNAGVVTIGANAVEGSMLNDNAISGQTAETDSANLGPDDELMISVDGSLKRADIKVLAQFLAGPGLTVAASGADEGKLLTQANNVQIFGDEDKALLEGMNAGSATLSADRTLTLPASPSSGDIVHVKAPASLGGNELIIQKGDAAHAIDGQASIQIESDGGAVSCMFIGSNTWVIF